MPPEHEQPPHVSADRFQDLVARIAAWGTRYWDSLEDRPVDRDHAPGAVLDALPAFPPDRPGDADEWDRVVRDLDDIILPALTHWQSPRFFAYFPCNVSEPGVLAELAGAMLNVNGMNWSTGPAITELETRMLDWMAHALGLPDAFLSGSPDAGGVIQSTASDATLVALLAARVRARRRFPDAGRALDARLTLYTSDQAHSSVLKAAMIAGLAHHPGDRAQFRLVPTTPGLGLDPDALGRMIRDDLAAGLVPCFVAATLGTTSTGAIDPLRRIAEVGAGSGADPWLHVDAAWAGAALVCPEHRGMIDGLELAHSLCVNPHKWLLTNFDCDLFWTRRVPDLTAALSVTPEYLRNTQSDAGAVVDYRDWQVPLGRRIRALKLWFVLRHYGVEGLRSHIRAGVAQAQKFERDLLEDDRFESPLTRSLSLCCVRLKAGDDRTRALHDALNASGELRVSHTVVDVRGAPAYLIRVAVGATRTRDEHIDQAVRAFRAHADAVLGSA